MISSKKITLSALMVALATVLMLASKLIPSPWLQGGSVTIASMVPIIALSIILGSKWGLLASVVYSLLQMITGFYPPPTQNIIDFVLVIMLDYVVAYGVLGIAGFFYRIFGKTQFAMILSTFLVTLLRFVCHIISGILIWGVYKEEGQSVLMYSLIYNGTYMIPEIIISMTAVAVISGFIAKKSKKF